MPHWKTAIIRTSCSQDRGTQPSIMGVRGPMIVSMKICFLSHSSWEHEEGLKQPW